MKILYIVRGLSGSGKTTLANELSPVVYSADDWFTDGDGVYEFDPAELANAHAECFSSVEFDMEVDVPKIAVANTFSQSWEAEPYFKLAKKYGYSPFVIECQNSFENVHEVPQETIDAMRERWENLT
jgi:predicted kinase